MNSKHIVLASSLAIALAAFVGCRDRRDERAGAEKSPSSSQTTGSGQTGSAPSASNRGGTAGNTNNNNSGTYGTGSNNNPSGATGGTTGGTTMGTNTGAAGSAAGTAAGSATQHTVGTAQLTGIKNSKASGTATFTGTEAGVSKVALDVKNAPKGTYHASMMDAEDCTAATKSTPASGAPTAATTAKIDLGTVEIDATGAGKAELSLTSAPAKFDDQVVVLYPEKATGAEIKSAIIACGPVKASAAGQGEG